MSKDTLPNSWTKTTRVIPAHFPREPSTVRDPNDRLCLVLDDYQTAENVSPHALTLALTHGTSFNKAFWELVLADLLSEAPSNHIVRRAIAIDVVNHGDSAVRNADKLGVNAFWPDISRDILRTLDVLSVQGPVVGIGHSFGGGTLLHAAMMAPTCFTATILVEPIFFYIEKRAQTISRVTLRRRDRWETLEEVRTSFRKAFSDWHPIQLDKYINDGTHYTEGHYTLKTPKTQESATYLAAPYPQILELLEQSSQRHHFIFGGDSKVINEKDRMVIERLSRRPGSVQVLEGAGHLIPMTHPQALSAILRCQLAETHKIIANAPSSNARL